MQAHLPSLTKPQATVLALWSLGMVLARSCARTAVRVFLATWLPRKEDAVRQQWRACGYAATAKRGTARPALVVETCLVPLWAWGVDQWEGTQLALALDATPLGTRLTGLALSVVYRGCAIPGAWTVLAATAQQAWRREWLRMLRQVRRAIPRAWTVMVLADRGLDARWLLRRITRWGWHPFVRIHTGGTFRPPGQVRGVPLTTLGPAPGTTWQGTGLAFKGRHRQLHGTLLACWEAGYAEPWLILTDLPPEARTAWWYGWRAWMEPGFKITKDDQTVRQIPPQFVLCRQPSGPPQQVHGFGETGPRGQQGLRWQGLECRHAPGVMGIVAVHQRHQGARVTERHKCPAFRFAST
jgi:hypothetical protein